MIIAIIFGIAIILAEISLISDKIVDLSIFRLIIVNLVNIPVLLFIFFIYFIWVIFYFASYSLIKIYYSGKHYCLCKGKETDAASLAMFCKSLSIITFPICVNAIKIFTRDNHGAYIVENYEEVLHSKSLKYITPLVPILLIFIIILNFFNCCGRYGFRKRRPHFSIKSSETNDYIKEGEIYLQEKHQQNMLNECIIQTDSI